MTGYYMGESQNLMTMMQTGGDAAIQRALQQRDEIDAIESAQRDEAKDRVVEDCLVVLVV